MCEKNGSSKILFEKFGGNLSFSKLGDPRTVKLATEFEIEAALNAPDPALTKSKANGLDFELEMIRTRFTEPGIAKVEKKLESLATPKKRPCSPTAASSSSIKRQNIFQHLLAHPMDQASVLESKQPNLKLTPTKNDKRSKEFANKVKKLVSSRLNIASEVEKARSLAKVDGSFDNLARDFRQAYDQNSSNKHAAYKFLVDEYRKMMLKHMAPQVLGRYKEECVKTGKEMVGDLKVIVKHMSNTEFADFIAISRAGKTDEFNRLLCKYRNRGMAAEGIQTEPMIISKLGDGSTVLAKKLFHEFEKSAPKACEVNVKRKRMRRQWQTDSEDFDKYVMNSDAARKFAEAFKAFREKRRNSTRFQDLLN